ncbi:MAG: family 43 glycosylhydrolase [Bryobacter sp.]|nr:family 43 glycosylhydrolase [Bryobacter sp.]
MQVTRRELPALLVGALAPQRRMMWADSSHLGRPYAKDPSVIRFGGRYLLYYSTPTVETAGRLSAWVIGIAESRDRIEWNKIGEVTPEQECERQGICAPCAKVIGGEVHIFYQTYGNGRADAICHAVSRDGLRFTRDATNPIWHPTGDWTAGRAIDAEVVEFRDRWLLYAATRDPAMKVQMIVGASAPRGRGFGRAVWTPLADRPLLKPELAWEKDCIEAASVVVRGDVLYMFYAGAYNNAPQQIGCARSRDGIAWERLSEQPLLACGKPGEWNASESGHPGAFVDEDGTTHLFFQGNNDKGRTWWLSSVRIEWGPRGPRIAT